MLRLVISLTILVCVFALPRNLEKRDTDKIAYPDEMASIPATTEGAKADLNAVAVDPENPEAPKGNGTDLDNRFLGVGLGLGYALGEKLLGGHHGGYYPHHGGGGYYPQHGGGGYYPQHGGGHYPQPYHGGGGFSGSQAQAQAQSQSFGGGFGGFGGSQSQAQAQSQSGSFGGGGWGSPYGGYY